MSRFICYKSDGTFSGADCYLGSATEHRTPDGYAGVVLFDDGDATAQDAFQNPSHYLVQNGELLQKPNVADLQLQDAINAQMSQINAAYEQATQTFKSSATGTSLTYLVEDGVTMSKFNAQYIYATSTMYNGNPFNFYTIENGGVSHTKDQFLQVWQNGHDWMQAMFVKWDNKIKQIKACKTVADVQSIIWIDTTVPVAPNGLTATAGTRQATLTWTANGEIDVQIGGGYNVYKAGTKVNTVPITGTSDIVTGLITGTSVTFAITAVDSDGNESPQSAPITVTPN